MKNTGRTNSELAEQAHSVAGPFGQQEGSEKSQKQRGSKEIERERERELEQRKGGERESKYEKGPWTLPTAGLGKRGGIRIGSVAVE